MLNSLPKQRRKLVSYDTVEDTARLLRVNEIDVDRAGLLDRRLDRSLGDLVEGYSLD